ncbi:pyridoxal phosphate-dependent decarboxylase family protein [Nakamurella endophytica]|uniref:Aspartate aminotransferase family protein n=1 Tax=Nakamurella endophytica TaxID=1748367 RepID=A0A917T1I9_9ACTN|nr:pyridoxal-dependent decarboxylase [Nakamurella endophytica]GGM05637.1 aspartate aminotransferase family protein [Nakamurella endophytica]
MSPRPGSYDPALSRAAEHARRWLDALDARPVPAQAAADGLLAQVGGALPEVGLPPDEVVDRLADLADPGLMAIGSGRFFGWVMGGVLPAALAADWLVSAWDQNAGMRPATPAAAALEEAAAGWLLDALGLPATAGVGFTTGATMANFTCLAAGRGRVLQAAGWDVHRDGLAGVPRVHVLVGAERHDTVDLTLRYLGLGAPTPVAADEQGRIRVDALAAALAEVPAGAPTLVCLQAGNVHSGAFDPFADAVEVAHRHGAWVHVDGAFGLWAAACPEFADRIRGLAAADSWATDAHKTLNVPYDCGIAVVADDLALRAALGVHASYLVREDAGPGNPYERVPELSRRARGIPVWAALRSLGRSGLVELVSGLAAAARSIAAGLGEVDGVEVLHEVAFTQVCFAVRGAGNTAGTDRTVEIGRALAADGGILLSGSRWHERDVLRISVSNWSTGPDEVAAAVAAVRRAVGSVGGSPGVEAAGRSGPDGDRLVGQPVVERRAL